MDRLGTGESAKWETSYKAIMRVGGGVGIMRVWTRMVGLEEWGRDSDAEDVKNWPHLPPF